jgi:hypothetical protein
MTTNYMKNISLIQKISNYFKFSTLSVTSAMFSEYQTVHINFTHYEIKIFHVCYKQLQPLYYQFEILTNV